LTDHLAIGVLTGLINALTIFTIKMIQVVSVTERWAASDIIVNMISGFMGGTNSALYVLFYTPIVEMIFGYTTDIKLLELGTEAGGDSCLALESFHGVAQERHKLPGVHVQGFHLLHEFPQLQDFGAQFRRVATGPQVIPTGALRNGQHHTGQLPTGRALIQRQLRRAVEEGVLVVAQRLAVAVRLGLDRDPGAVIENSPSDGTACRRFVTLMDVFTPVNVMVAVSAPDPIVIELVPSPVHGVMVGSPIWQYGPPKT
jgi:hypothetical protein